MNGEPVLFLGYNFDYKDLISENILSKSTGLMINAYYLFINKRKISWINDSLNQLNFKGKIMVDSGGFQLCKSRYISTNRKNDFSQIEILKLQLQLCIDYAVSLDYPISSFENPDHHRKNILKSLKNVKTCIKIITENKLETPLIVPVIHGYDRKNIEFTCKKLEKIEREYDYKFQTIGIGSLVPLVAARAKNGMSLLINVFKILNSIEYLKHKRIHAFGAGSPFLMRLYFYLGADSLDTRSWIINARFGKIFMQNSGRKIVSDLIDKYGEDSHICDCPICKRHSLKELNESRKLRVFHNAHVCLNEFNEIKKEKIHGCFRNKTEEILENKPKIMEMIANVSG